MALHAPTLLAPRPVANESPGLSKVLNYRNGFTIRAVDEYGLNCALSRLNSYVDENNSFRCDFQIDSCAAVDLGILYVIRIRIDYENMAPRRYPDCHITLPSDLAHQPAAMADVRIARYSEWEFGGGPPGQKVLIIAWPVEIDQALFPGWRLFNERTAWRPDFYRF